MTPHRWTAPAKTNLTLKVLGKRDDGFHELETLMVPLSLHDVLSFERLSETEDGYRLRCNMPGVPTGEKNLVTRAVRAFERQTERACRWEVILEKRIPHGAGMGGGSSDAATTLLALNTLERTGFSLDELSSIGAGIGSDVPFFIYQSSCMVTGRGEVVKPVEIAGLSGSPVLLFKPSFGVSTPDAFKNFLNSEPLPDVDYSPRSMPWGEILNDLEKPVFYKHRFLAEMKIWLGRQPEVKAAMMSGSGSTMVAFLHDFSNQGKQIFESADDLKKRACIELDPSLWSELAHIL